MKKIVVLFLIAASGFAFKNAENGYKAGDTAADFKLKNVTGKMVSLADYSTAKGFIVVFTCNHCPVAKAYEKRIMALDKEYTAKGYPVIAISPNDPVAEPADSYVNMQKRAASMKYTFPYLIDESQQITRTFGAQSTPTAYVLKKTNKGIVVEYVGAIDNDQEDINPTRTKYVENAVKNTSNAIGCRIVWKKS
jgi:peroxiredoxin